MKKHNFIITGLVFSSLLIFGFGYERDFFSEIKGFESSINQEPKLSIFKKLTENDQLEVEERISLYYQLKKDSYTLYNFEDENELNKYGYHLLENKKIDDAIQIFKLLVSEFPNSSNAYDSMGEAYLKNGNEDLALLNYEKSVKLNPKNTFGIDQINRLKGLEILLTDWGKEIFHFPIHFVPELDYQGVEEVVFPKNWAKKDSNDFWSYVFVWALDNKKEISPAELEINLRKYFDGLAAVVNEDKETEMIKTSTYFQHNTNSNDDVDIIGQLTVYDAFTTNKPLDLNARIFSNYCEKRGKLIVLFQFSPKKYDHPIWDKLRTVKVRSTVCEK